MARFYSTAKPTFIEDNIYNPPIEMMANLLGVQEERTDELLKKTDLLESATDTIQHLNFGSENERVNKLQSKYRDSIKDISDKIFENPLEFQKFSPMIKKLQRDMIQDKTSGEWFNIEQRHSDYQNWVKDNEKLRESNPTLYNQLNNHWFTDIVTRGSQDSEARFAGQKIIDRPDLSSPKYRQIFEKIKANNSEMFTEDGNFKVSVSQVDKDRVLNVALSELTNDPDYKGFVNQMGNVLGDKRFLEPFITKSENEKGEEIASLNPKNPFAGDLSSVVNTYGFRDQKIEETKTLGHKQTLQQIAARNKSAIQLEFIKQKGTTQQLLLKYQLEGEKAQEEFKNKLILSDKPADKKILNQLTAKETLGAIGNPNANLDSDYTSIENNKEQTDIPNDGRAYIYASPGTTEYAAQQRVNNSTRFATDKLGDSDIKLNNGSEFKAQEYFDWLGDRKHTEDTAKDFLQKEKSVFQSSGSIAQETANNLRWTPSWIKSNSAEDWDKVYQMGNRYEDKRKEWYKNYSEGSQQVSFQPITNSVITNNILGEIKSNPENFYVTDADGNTPKKFRDILSKIDTTSELFVTAANAHNEMGMKVNIDDKEFYVFPDNGDNATSNLMTNLSMLGVDKNSTYFQEMSDRISSNLLFNLNQTGKNSKGNKSIVTRLNGIEISLELIGDRVELRDPNQGLDTAPVRTFSNMREFTKAFYSTQDKQN